jgi:hypothetical protein
MSSPLMNLSPFAPSPIAFATIRIFESSIPTLLYFVALNRCATRRATALQHPAQCSAGSLLELVAFG